MTVTTYVVITPFFIITITRKQQQNIDGAENNYIRININYFLSFSVGTQRIAIYVSTNAEIGERKGDSASDRITKLKTKIATKAGDE